MVERRLKENHRLILVQLYTKDGLTPGQGGWWPSPDRSTTVQAQALINRGLATKRRIGNMTQFKITNAGVTVALRGGRLL